MYCYQAITEYHCRPAHILEHAHDRFMASQCSHRLARCTLVHSCANITVARACALLAIGINLTMLPWQCGGFCMGLQGAKLPRQWGVVGIAPLFLFPTHRPGQRAQV